MHIHEVEGKERQPFAYRAQDGAQPVKVTYLGRVNPKGQRVRVRFDDRHEDEVSVKRLIAAWDELPATLERERHAKAFQDYILRHDLYETPLEEAVGLVFAATGERGADTFDSGTQAWPSEWERVMARAGIDGSPLDLSPVAYIEQDGYLRVPIDAVSKLAEAFAAAEPDVVRIAVREREEYLRAQGYDEGRLWIAYCAGRAIVRRWIEKGDGLQMRDEVARLREELAELRARVEAMGA